MSSSSAHAYPLAAAVFAGSIVDQPHLEKTHGERSDLGRRLRVLSKQRTKILSATPGVPSLYEKVINVLQERNNEVYPQGTAFYQLYQSADADLKAKWLIEIGERCGTELRGIRSDCMDKAMAEKDWKELCAGLAWMVRFEVSLASLLALNTDERFGQLYHTPEELPTPAMLASFQSIKEQGRSIEKLHEGRRTWLKERKTAPKRTSRRVKGEEPEVEQEQAEETEGVGAEEGDGGEYAEYDE